MLKYFKGLVTESLTDVYARKAWNKLSKRFIQPLGIPRQEFERNPKIVK